MEQQDLLPQENVEMQNQEVNSGASVEAQDVTTQESSAPAEETENQTADVPVEQPVDEQPAPTESVVEGETPAAPAEAPAVQPVSEAAAPQQVSAEEMVAEMDRQQTAAEPEVESEEPEEPEAAPTETLEQVEAEYANFDLAQCVAELERIVVEPNFNIIKQRVGVLRAKAIEFFRERRRALLAEYNAAKAAAEAAAAENPEAPVEEIPAPTNEPDEIEKRFNAAFQQYKDSKAKFIEQLEEQKLKNLEAKNRVLDGLKNLIETESNLKVLNDKFKELQDEWKNIGQVPQTESTNLWQNYHFYVDKFFDILRMNKEMRALDLKKNLESKLELCQKAESLLLMDSINQSFKELQALHEQWKEIGPVPEEKKEEVWERFKMASDQINARRKEFYEKIFADEQNNYNAKVVLCEQAEELVSKSSDNVKNYNEVSEKLTEILNVWKTLGPAPAKLNDEIWNRFKSTLDKFFTTKKEYFQQIKDSQMQNYNQKLNLAIQAEGLADRTDWKQATAEILNLQAEWKKIGSTPRKYSDQIWKRFRAACDKFFEAKSNYFNNIQDVEADNLRRKEELIQKILTHEFGDDRNANMDVLKGYQNEWIEIGFVPKKDKDRIHTAYREALNKRFAELKISADDLRHNRFRSKIDSILSRPDSEKVLDKENRFLRDKVAKLKEDITLWENNIGFFSNSKNAEIITAEFRRKIDTAKSEVKDLEYKIRMMNKPQAPKTDETNVTEETSAPAE